MKVNGLRNTGDAGKVQDLNIKGVQLEHPLKEIAIKKFPKSISMLEFIKKFLMWKP